ncbi:MAG: hypothetical protein QNJ46_06775 [Leptolyngbyaceae cyanobacterium MO_188.B28]|nr:hypothetical protein [Leptolyngbyaceae cyanobacterium MO_188.B28]
MQVKWRELLLKTSIWITAEIMLSLIGLDNLADYSEFIFQNRVMPHIGEVVANLTTSV